MLDAILEWLCAKIAGLFFLLIGLGGLLAGQVSLFSPKGYMEGTIRDAQGYDWILNILYMYFGWRVFRSVKYPRKK